VGDVIKWERFRHFAEIITPWASIARGILTKFLLETRPKSESLEQQFSIGVLAPSGGARRDFLGCELL